MNTRIATATLASLMVCGLLGPIANAQDKDKVFLVKGVTAVGKIESITRDEVKIAVKGKTQTYATNEVAKVVFDDEPNSLDNARTLISNRQFNQADAELKKIPAQKDERIAKEVAFYKGYVAAKLALSGMGDPKAAAGVLMAAHKANTDSHNAYKAAETLGDLAMAMNLPDAANTFYKELASAKAAEVKATAAYKQGDVALTTGKLPEARKFFEQLINAKIADPDAAKAIAPLKNLSEVGLAVCEAKEGKSEEALGKLQELVKKSDSTDQLLFARIYNAMGVCYQALGKDREATLAYLRTDLLFPISPELHAEALYQLTLLFPKIGDPQQGMKARTKLTSKYPASSWASKK